MIPHRLSSLALAVTASLIAVAPAYADTCTVDAGTAYQRIDGFGASSAYIGTPWTSDQADEIFSPDKGLGLSLLRVKITADVTGTGTASKMLTSSAEIGIAQQAIARGARIWATPWSPPAQFKSSNNTTGGNFVSSNYQAYANMLASYVATMKSSGVNLYALSIQNEPDFIPSGYEGCGWSAQQFHDFVPVLYNALAANGVGSTRIMMPESDNWQNQAGMAAITTTLNDPAVAPMVGIVANHDYAANNQIGSMVTPANLPHQGKALWETEVATTSPFDGGIANGMYWAQRLHLFMTAAQASAWHWWWFQTYTPAGSTVDNSGLLGPNWQMTKRACMVGQFAKFVRPGFYRIGATTSGTALVSAYKDPASGRFAIVAINPTASPITETFSLANFSASNVTPTVTDATQDLASQAAIPVTNATFTAMLGPTSTTTFVGTDTTPPPPLSSSKISNLSIRSFAGTGDQTLIAGFYASGQKRVLIRAAGPALSFAIPMTQLLAQPQLTLIQGSNQLGFNAGWDTATNAPDVAAVTPTVGAFPFTAGAADSALLTNVADALYSAQVTGPNSTTGIVLVEVYDANVSTGGRLTNVSARTLAGSGANALIAGFYITGTQPKTLLIRGVGPTLGAIGVGGAMMDPKLDVFYENDAAPMFTNTSWGSGNPFQVESAGHQVGAFPLVTDSNDAAMVVTLQPNHKYSAVVSSVSNATGVALVELYELQ